MELNRGKLNKKLPNSKILQQASAAFKHLKNKLFGKTNKRWQPEGAERRVAVMRIKEY